MSPGTVLRIHLREPMAGIALSFGNILINEGAPLTVTSIVAVPVITGINGIYPNPFNPSTTLSYSVSGRQFVQLGIFDINGKKVRSLVHSVEEGRFHRVVWNGTNDDGVPVASGVYFASLRVGKSVMHRKMTLSK